MRRGSMGGADIPPPLCGWRGRDGKGIGQVHPILQAQMGESCTADAQTRVPPIGKPNENE